MSSNQAPDKEENREDELGSDCQCQATPRSLAAGSVSISTVLERFAQAPLVEGRREAAVPGLPAAGAAVRAIGGILEEHHLWRGQQRDPQVAQTQRH